MKIPAGEGILLRSMSSTAVPEQASEPKATNGRGPFRFVVTLILLTVVVIFMGIMTTSTGSGLAFKDWPLSDGELMPERSLNTAEGFFEHFHRLPAGLALLMSIGLAFWCNFKSATASRGLKRITAVAAVLISVQALIGGLGVLAELPRLNSAAHGTLAQIVISLFAVTAYMLSRRHAATVPQPHPRAASARKLAFLMLVLIVTQTVFGAIARHSPPGEGSHALWTHVGNAVLVFLVVVIALGVTSRLEHIPGLKGLGRWGMILLMLQITLGFVALMVREGKHPENVRFLWRALLISSHVLIGAALTVLAALLYAHVRRGTKIGS